MGHLFKTLNTVRYISFRFINTYERKNMLSKQLFQYKSLNNGEFDTMMIALKTNLVNGSVTLKC